MNRCLYVLIHEHFDHSGFTVCGVTSNHALALSWYHANDENDVYPVSGLGDTKPWQEGFKSWRVTNGK